jgi:hypothetical protein
MSGLIDISDVEEKSLERMIKKVADSHVKIHKELVKQSMLFSSVFRETTEKVNKILFPATNSYVKTVGGAKEVPLNYDITPDEARLAQTKMLAATSEAEKGFNRLDAICANLTREFSYLISDMYKGIESVYDLTIALQKKYK